jgi:hypothetical protein
MGPILPVAELVAPLAMQALGPIVQDIGKSLGGALGGLGGAQQGAGGLQGILQEITQTLGQLQKLLGGPQQGGICPGQPFPFSPGQFPPGIRDNPFSRLPNFTGGGSGDLGTSGTAWANAAANAAGGKSYSQLQADLSAAEQSGDPAKLAAANAAIQRYDNFAQMLSDAEKKKNDTIASISRNLN